METHTKNIPTLHVDSEVMLPDNDKWQFRIEIKSESSDRIYIVSQNKQKRYWACSCMGWKRFRHCKHLEAIGVPNYEKPFEVNIIQD